MANVPDCSWLCWRSQGIGAVPPFLNCSLVPSLELDTSEAVHPQDEPRPAFNGLSIGYRAKDLRASSQPIRSILTQVGHFYFFGRSLLRCHQGVITLSGMGVVDELRSDAHPLSGLSHAALEHVAHAELAPDLLYVDRFPLVNE
jgi:hypothetical protein